MALVRGVAPAAATATARAAEVEARAARLASLGADRLALLAESLSTNLAAIAASFTAGYASAEARDAMVRKTNLKAQADEMETYLSSKPCAVVSRRLPFQLTSGGRASAGGAERLRTVGLTNRVVVRRCRLTL